MTELARRADVPRWWLYEHPELREVIDEHRRAGQLRPSAVTSDHQQPATDEEPWVSALAAAVRTAAGATAVPPPSVPTDQAVDDDAPPDDLRHDDGRAWLTPPEQRRRLWSPRPTGVGRDDDAEEPVFDKPGPDDEQVGRCSDVEDWSADLLLDTPSSGSSLEEERLRARAAEEAPELGEEDLESAVAAGALATTRARADPRQQVGEEEADAVGETAAIASALRIAQVVDLAASSSEWLPYAGVVVPVLGSAAGVGASVFAVSLFDALEGAGVRTLLVDTADPARSGLSAISDQGPVVRRPADDLAICASRRGGGFVLRLAAPPDGVFRASMVPAPQWWLPQNRAPEVTIVDLGWDPSPLVDHPLRGPAAWLRAPDDGDETGPWPVLVCAPTRPSVSRANQVVTRLRPWIVVAGVSEVAGLVVSGAARWPRGVGGVVGPQLAGLEPPYFLPHDRRIAVSGPSSTPMPMRMQRVAGRLADAWGLR